MRRPLRFLLASYVLVGSVDWVLAVALTTVVFDRTGSAGWVAATVALRFLPSVVLAPLSGVLADRFDRRYLLAASSGLRLVDLLLLAGAAAAGASPPVILALAVVDAVLATPYRPAALAILPRLAPGAALAEANAALAGAVQLTWIVGPAIGAVAVRASPALTFVMAAVAVGVAGGLVLGIAGDHSPGGRSTELPRSAPQMLRDGAVALCRSPGALPLLGLMIAVEVVFGFELVAHVSVAAERLGLGPEGAGWMTATIGLGGVVGASMAAASARGRHAGLLAAVAGAGFGVALAALAATQSRPLVFGVLVGEGMANVVYDVLTLTLLQQLLSGALLARGQALVDAVGAVALTVGSLAAPLVIGRLGLSGALVAVGVAMIAVAVVMAVPLATLDRRLSARVAALAPVVEELRATALLAAAPYSTVERLAASAVTTEVLAGTVIVREGDQSDAMYVVAAGRLAVTVTDDGGRRLVVELGAGEWFGEIGVLRRMGRTATVAAMIDARLWRIPAEAVRAAADGRLGIADPLRRVVARRLARTHPGLVLPAQVGGPSGEAETAVDRERGAGDVRVAHQEEDAVGDLLGSGDASEWGALRLGGDHRLEAVTGHVGQHGGVDDAGPDDVDPDRRQLEGGDPGEDLRAAGGRRHDGAAAAGPGHADARADRDGAVGHLRGRVPADVESTPQAAVDRSRDDRGVDGGDLAVGARPGQHGHMVDVVEGGEQVLHRSFVGDVERYPASTATELVERAGESSLVASDHGDPGAALLRQRGRRQSDPGRPTDHHHVSTLE
jgi:CRP-like cAMP-binding protein/predicted MFS family arabinose efflux permease